MCGWVGGGGVGGEEFPEFRIFEFAIGACKFTELEPGTSLPLHVHLSHSVP